MARSKPIPTPPSRPRLLSTRRSKHRAAAFLALLVVVAILAVLLNSLHTQIPQAVRVFSWTALVGAIWLINNRLPSDRKRNQTSVTPSRRARR